MDITEQLVAALRNVPDNDAEMIEHNHDEGMRLFCCYGDVVCNMSGAYTVKHAPGCWYVNARAALAAYDELPAHDHQLNLRLFSYVASVERLRVYEFINNFDPGNAYSLPMLESLVSDAADAAQVVAELLGLPDPYAPECYGLLLSEITELCPALGALYDMWGAQTEPKATYEATDVAEEIQAALFDRIENEMPASERGVISSAVYSARDDHFIVTTNGGQRWKLTVQGAP